MTSVIGVKTSNLPQSSESVSFGVVQSLKSSGSLRQEVSHAVDRKDLATREAMLTRVYRSINGLFVSCKEFGVYACETIKLLVQRSVTPLAFAAVLACIPGMPILGAMNFSKFSAHLLTCTLGSLANTILNRVTSGKFDIYVHETLKFSVKIVKNAIIPVALSAVLLSRFGFNLNLRPDLFARAGLSNLVAKLATSYVAKFTIMASIGTLINAISGLINTSVSGVAKFGAHAYSMVKLVAIQTFPLVAVTIPILLNCLGLSSGGIAALISGINLALCATDKFTNLKGIGQFSLRAFQAALTIFEIPFRLVYLLLHAKDFNDAIKIVKSELISIPANKLRILQKPQIQFQGFDDAGLNESEMNDVKVALAIAGEARGRSEGNPARLREALMKRGLVLIDSTTIPGGIPEPDLAAMTKFLDRLRLNDGKFRFENGAIRTQSGMQATIAYDKTARFVRIFYHGTDFEPTSRGAKTILADIRIVSSPNVAEEMVNDAIQLAQFAVESFGDMCRVIGHSLGGGICQIVSARTWIRGISINPAPVNEDFFAESEMEELEFARRTGVQISLDNDPLSNAILMRNGGAVNLFGRKINLPFSGRGNSHMAEVVLEASEQTEVQDRHRAMIDVERLPNLREKVSMYDRIMTEAARELNGLNDQHFFPELKGKARNKRKTELRKKINEAEEAMSSTLHEIGKIETKAAKAMNETREALRRTEQFMAWTDPA
ncbi:MAG: hypothetical protein LBB15_00755 [Puniceicoccales bacterium]|nr:hypothetical protein [Puniceicoccales bacterium]